MWLGGRRGHRPNFRERVFDADDQEGFPGLDAPQVGEEVTLKGLHADGTHVLIVAGLMRRTSHRSTGTARACSLVPGFPVG